MPTAPAYPETFRRQAVDLISSEKLTIPDAARRLGVDAKTLRKWVTKYRPTTATTPPSVEPELRRRREENRQWENAPTESFFATLKKEMWYRRSFADEVDAERAVFESIEVFYNRQRLHSTLGYVSPATFESRQPTHTVN